MSGVLSRILPARAAATPHRVVADFDQLIDEPVAFIFKGKKYDVNPVDTKTFMRMAQILGEIQELLKSQSQGKELHQEDIYNAYYRYITPLCPKFTVEMLKAMTLTQVHALLNLIIKHVTGQPMNMEEAEKKKMSLLQA